MRKSVTTKRPRATRQGKPDVATILESAFSEAVGKEGELEELITAVEMAREYDKHFGADPRFAAALKDPRKLAELRREHKGLERAALAAHKRWKRAEKEVSS